MKNREELIQLYKESMEDYVLSRGEKRAIKEAINEANFSDHDRHFIRSQIFDMARERQEHPEDVWVVNWLEEAVKSTLTKGSSQIEQSQVLFSPGQECKNVIINQLRKSVNEILICVFTISDNDITNAIIDAHRRGRRVLIITDKDKIYDRGSDVLQLKEVGVPIKVEATECHMHHKYALFDNERLITGSYNWTRSAAFINFENILLTQEIAAVRSYANEFKRLWEKLPAL